MGVHQLSATFLFPLSDLQKRGIHGVVGGQCHTLGKVETLQGHLIVNRVWIECKFKLLKSPAIKIFGLGI